MPAARSRKWPHRVEACVAAREFTPAHPLLLLALMAIESRFNRVA
jgi:hypothetical protein